MKKWIALFLFYLSSLSAHLSEEATLYIESNERVSSGFLISDEGLAITLSSGIEDPEEIWVARKGEKFQRAQLVAEMGELALIQLEGEGFPHLIMEGEGRLGEMILYAGFCRRDVFTLRLGNITQLEGGFMLISFPFNPVEVGGPILNLDGEVIGIAYTNTRGEFPYGVILPIDFFSHFGQLVNIRHE